MCGIRGNHVRPPIYFRLLNAVKPIMVKKLWTGYGGCEQEYPIE
jgi:hypothetical protein